MHTQKVYKLMRKAEFVTLLNDCPQISFDLNGSFLTTEEAQCGHCEETGQLLRRICAHTDLAFCEDEGCKKKLSCWNCGRLGQIECTVNTRQRGPGQVQQ